MSSEHPAPLNVAVIGCGMMANGAHLPNVVSNPGLRLRWVCDIDEGRARAAAERFGAEYVTTDYRQVLADLQLDFSILATAHSVRGAFIAASAQAGKAVLAEKPMAGSAVEVAQVLKDVRASGIPFCVNHNRRSAPAVLDALEILRKWEADPVVAPWRLDRNTHLRPLMHEESQRMVLIRINDDSFTWKPWAFSDSAFLNEMTHFIDLAQLFMDGRRPVQVSAMGSTRMNFTLCIGYDDGSVASLVHSAVGTLDYPKELFEITTHGAMVAIDHLMEVRVAGIPGEPFRRTYPTLDARAATDQQGIAQFYDAAQQTIETRLATGENDLFIGSPNKGHYAHLDRFADCVRGLGPSPCDATEAAIVTMLTLKAQEACRLGLPLRFGPDEYEMMVLE